MPIGAGSKKKPTAKVPHLDIRVGRRDRLEVLQRYRKAGFRNRWVKMGDNPTDTESRIEEMEELGYGVVESDKGGPVTRSGMLLMEIPEDTYRARERAKLEANLAANRAQAETNRALMRRALGSAPDARVLEGERVEETPEALLTDEDLATSGLTG